MPWRQQHLREKSLRWCWCVLPAGTCSCLCVGVWGCMITLISWCHCACQGSAAAMVVHDGHYSTPADGPTATRTGEALCPRGHACKRGVAQACSAGSFAAANGSTSCSPCDAGYYCPAGSVSQIECGGEDVYCPERSGEPIPVPVGMYSAPVDAGVAVRWQALPCAAGQYCVGGVTVRCSSAPLE